MPRPPAKSGARARGNATPCRCRRVTHAEATGDSPPAPPEPDTVNAATLARPGRELNDERNRIPDAYRGARRSRRASPGVRVRCSRRRHAAARADSTQRITPNFKDADITQIAEAVSAATGKNFIIDPRVRAQVTMLSSTPMSPDAFYQAFLSILQVHGFVAVAGRQASSRSSRMRTRASIPSNDLPDHVSSSSDEIVTQVIAVKNVNAAQLVPILRPLIPQYGHLAAYPASNILIISDRANNVNRIMRIIQRIDQVGDADVEIVPLQNASATEVVRVINSLYQQQAATEGAASAFKLVADERSNSVLLKRREGHAPAHRAC